MTQVELAAVAGVSHISIAKIETNAYGTTKLVTLERIAKGLGLPVAYLVAEDVPVRRYMRRVASDDASTDGES